MKVRDAMRGYYFITDHRLTRAGIFSDCRNAVAAGVGVVQYRNKEASTKHMREEAQRLRSICGSRVKLLINDRIDIALAVGADGVHLGQDDMPCVCARKLLGSKAVIGVTVHSVKEALIAEKSGADYLGVSPIFATATKKDAGKPAGLQLLRDIRRRTRLPLAAIGGITLDNAGQVIASGADAVCAISCVVTKPDVKVRIGRFQRLFPASHG